METDISERNAKTDEMDKMMHKLTDKVDQLTNGVLSKRSPNDSKEETTQQRSELSEACTYFSELIE